MERPKSIYIAFEVFPRPKGASAHIASMAEAMAASYGPVLILCLGFGDMPSFQREGPFIIRRFKGYHPNMLKRSEGFADFVYKILCGLETDPQLCVFRDPWSGTAAISSGRCMNMVFEVNALPSWELEYTYPGFSADYCLREKIRDLEYFCLENSHRILTVSEVTAGALEKKGVSRERIQVVPNSPPGFFVTPPADEAVPDFVNTGDWIGYFGSLHEWQGVDTGIRAFAKVAGAFENLRMVIVTGGRKEAKKALRKRIRKLGLEDRVIIHPPVVPETLAAIVRRLRFTVAPLAETPRNTFQGCCPIKIIESMAAGTPVIASDLACVRPIVDNYKDGMLVRPGNIRALALAMQRCLSDRMMTEKLGRNAAGKIRKKFSRGALHEQLLRCFKPDLIR